MKSRFRSLRVGLLAALLLVAGCGREAPDQASDSAAGALGQPVPVEGGGAYLDIGVAELQAILTGNAFTLVNVHVPFEGDLPGTDLSIAYDQIDDHLALLPEDRDAPIVLYCRTGRMSAIAGEELVRLGYTRVYQLVGGFIAWRDAGLPLLR